MSMYIIWIIFIYLKIKLKVILNEINPINNLEKNQIRSLFSQAYTANIAIFVGGCLIVIAFILANENDNIVWFLSVLTISLGGRIFIALRANKGVGEDLTKYANYYIILTFILGLNFSFLYFISFNSNNHELRALLTVVSFGLITGAIASLAVWLRAYFAFIIPQSISLFTYYYINEGIIAALAIIVFIVFIVRIAINFNSNFKDGRALVSENIKLISAMEQEITTRKKAQQELENNKFELEDKINDRTLALEASNQSLNQQIDKIQTIEKELEFLAYYDSLTGLPNKNLFIDDVKRAITQAKRTESLLGVLFIDLDRFKNINDSYGHHIGDELLKSVAVRLREVLRDSDIISRNGGDEFSVLIENMKDAREPFVVANKIVKCLNERFIIKHHNVHIGASVGISMFPLDGKGALELIEMADTAMYESKKLGRNNFQFYSSAMSNQIADRLKLENALRYALSNNEFYIVYQPQIDIIKNKTIGLEALLRWNSPIFGIIPPSEFITILEDTGLIYSVGEWVILEVINFIKSGHSHNTKVSINLSVLQCGVSNYSRKIKTFFDDSGIDPSLVEFEVTETLLINDFNQTEMFLSDISNLGCTVALDDFGTGYTSFSYLTKLPIDIIKIDKSLVSEVNLKDELQNIILAIVTMSKSLGIDNVFEGVETQEELEIIKKVGGTIIQGYLFSKPIESADVSPWLLSESTDNTKYSL